MKCIGSWEKSARNIKYNGNLLKCELKKKNGSWQYNELYFIPNIEYHNIDGFFNKPQNIKNKWIVLLTTSINNNNKPFSDTEINFRKGLYTKQINKWLQNTPFHIVIIESSGYEFPEISHERLHKYTFQITRKINSSSQYEAESILYVLEKIKNTNFLKNCTHILKVTGRYFLENIEQELNKKTPNFDLYLQIHRRNNWQNSEYYGIKKELFEPLAISVKENGLFEVKLFDFSTDKSVCFLNPFPNDIKRGGDGLLINPL
jgi:hypothetical protein